jgi:thymidylate synthase (FAD)
VNDEGTYRLAAYPEWLQKHRNERPYGMWDDPEFSAGSLHNISDLENVPTAFNNHDKNDGTHVSPFDTGRVLVGVDGLQVRLGRGLNFAQFQQTIATGTLATIGRARPTGPGPYSDLLDLEALDWAEMFKGGLQGALESAVLSFEVWGASRVLTHQLVRSTRARFMQQSQRSTWYGDRPEVRMPESVWRSSWEVREQWLVAYKMAWRAYQMACNAGVPYEDARYILPEGTVNYIQCNYSIREFMAVYAYRGCSMFLREMVEVMRMMRSLVVETTPELEPYIKVSCETGKGCLRCGGTGWTYLAFGDSEMWAATKLDDQTDAPEGMNAVVCPECDGTTGRKCTFQGWENVELACSKPMARENNRVFLASPKLRIGA